MLRSRESTLRALPVNRVNCFIWDKVFKSGLSKFCGSL